MVKYLAGVAAVPEPDASGSTGDRHVANRVDSTGGIRGVESSDSEFVNSLKMDRTTSQGTKHVRKTSVYLSRVAGGHRDHRHARNIVVARRSSRAGSSKASCSVKTN